MADKGKAVNLRTQSEASSPKYILNQDLKRTSPGTPTKYIKKKRTKTFTGCFTCRKRKIGCDLGKPSCLNCQKAGFECGGYDVKLRWSNPIKFDPYGCQLPQVPLNEGEYQHQRRKVEYVVYPKEQQYKHYEDMDDDLSTLHYQHVVGLNEQARLLGPFGVFRGEKLNANHRKNNRTSKKVEPIIPSNSSSTNLAKFSTSTTPRNSVSRLPHPPSNLSTPASLLQSANTPALTTTNFNNDNANGLGNEWLSKELIDAALLTASALNGDTHFLDWFKPNSLDPLPNFNDQAHHSIQPNNSLSNPQTPKMSQQLLPPTQTHQQANVTQSNLNMKNAIEGVNNHSLQAWQSFGNHVPDQMLHLLFQGRNQTPIPTVSPNKDPIKNNSPAALDTDGSYSQSSPSIDPIEPSSSSHNGNNSTKKLFNRTKTTTARSLATNDLNIHAGNGSQMPKQIMEILTINTPLPKSLDIDNFGIPTTSLKVHPMARYLLNYYVRDVADAMTVIPLPKNPWKFIYFPRAMLAIGELASLGKTSNARNALLNALLAVSAFNLQSKFVRGSDEMKYYVDLGVQLRQQASNFLRKCLEEDILLQKYKDVLVAVLSMVTIDVVWGTMSGCKVHLDHCEKIIEKKMKVKKKLSSKAIILHRIFSNLKLIQDSTALENIQKEDMFLNERNYKTFIIGANPGSRDELERFNNNSINGMFKNSRGRKSTKRNKLTASSQNQSFNASNVSDSPTERFSTPTSTAGGTGVDSPANKQGIYNEKITDTGRVRIEYIVNNDDDDMGSSRSTGRSVYDSSAQVPAFIDITRTSFQPSKNKLDDKIVSSDAIYGLPNSLILMFSEVVHLTRFKKYHDDNKIPLPSFFDELSFQIEFKLLSWKLEWNLTLDDDDDDMSTSSTETKKNFISPRYEGIYHHVYSFYNALIIFYYKFVEEINPMYLQDRVEKVLYHLNEIQNIVEKNPGTLIIPLFWQGFIAGSEAMTLFLQNGFNSWGQHIAETGVGTYWNSRQIMLEVWKRKNYNVKNNSWVDVLRDWKTNVMLT